MHSAALDPHSLFWMVYEPPAAEVVCELQSVVVAAWELTAGTTTATMPPAPKSTAAASVRACFGQVMRASSDIADWTPRCSARRRIPTVSRRPASHGSSEPSVRPDAL